jgi:hypothetical protein
VSICINVWTPEGSVDAYAKCCEVLRSEAASMFSRREYSVYVPPVGSLDIKSFIDF